jgi:protein-S-isoprenylcysteine O-methyltransferase Ste14
MSLTDPDPNPHFFNWASLIAWFATFIIFLVFVPFYRKTRRRSTSMYIAFIVASAFEMFGIPLSMYIVSWALGTTIPVGIFWGHTLQQIIGYRAMLIGFTLNIIGGALIVLGWKVVHKQYWQRQKGEGKLVTTGIYAYIRHPQYTGFIVMTLGLLVHWATIPLLIMWPILTTQYYRLAQREERDMEIEFGDTYRTYKHNVPMFIPRLLPRHRITSIH